MKAIAADCLQGVAWLLFGVAGLAFWVGGRMVSEMFKIDRLLAEMGGIVVAVVCGGLGAWAKQAGEGLKPYDDADSASGDEQFRN